MKVKRPGRVQISQRLVREILRNLGASPKLTDAAAEKFLGKSFSFLVRHGGIPNWYQNRDRLVAELAFLLRDGLWKLKREDQ